MESKLPNVNLFVSASWILRAPLLLHDHKIRISHLELKCIWNPCFYKYGVKILLYFFLGVGSICFFPMASWSHFTLPSFMHAHESASELESVP